MRTFYAIKVEPMANNNKFYEMKETSGGSFVARWGRVGATGQSKTYPMYDWDRIVRDKLGKGYVEQTALKSDTGFSFKSLGGSIDALVNMLRNAAGGSVSGNYVEADKITKAQIDRGQAILDELGSLNGRATVDAVNSGLVRLWTVLPRKMRSVSAELLPDNATRKQISEKLEREQEIIDQLAGQVATPVTAAQDDQTVLEAMGIELREATPQEFDKVMSLVEPESKHKISRVFAARNKVTQTAFEAWKPGSKVRLFFHGSSTENWWNIIGQGLKIRPAATNGSMFGRGLYFADKARKSIGYTSLSGSHWAHGRDGRAYMAVFAVKMGETKITDRSDSSAHHDAKRGLFDSIWAKAGNQLYNDEFIVYNDSQTTIAYLVELKA